MVRNVGYREALDMRLFDVSLALATASAVLAALCTSLLLWFG